MAFTKTGLEFFYVDCNESIEERMMIKECGNKGTSAFLYLQRYIYGGQGYYAVFDEKLKKYFDVCYDISENEITEFINTCIKYDLFNKELFDEYNILTSEEIQRKYLEAVKRRSNKELKPEYKLITTKEDKEANEYKIKIANVQEQRDITGQYFSS